MALGDVDYGLRAGVTMVGRALIRSLGEMEPLAAPGSGEPCVKLVQHLV